MIRNPLDNEFSIAGAALAAVDGWLGAPFGGEAADGYVGGFIEAEQVAADAAVEEGAVGIGVGEVGGLELEVTEFVENRFGAAELVVAEGVEVEHGERLHGAYRCPAAATLLTVGVPPVG